MNIIKNVFLLLLCSIFSLNVYADIKAFKEGKLQHQGYFSFYHDASKGKVYLVVDKFNQEFLFQSAMPHGVGSNDIGLDRGQLGQTRLVQFERAGDKVFLRQLNPYYRANSSNIEEKKAVREAFATSILWGFKIEETDGDNVIIDYTPFLMSDIHQLSSRLKSRKQGNYKIDNSRSAFYPPRSKAFSKNTELEATITFKGTGAGRHLRSVTPENTAVTVNFHHSLIQLPDDKYQTREFHPFSGMWALSYADYATPIEQPLVKRVIKRHRLEKKNPNAKQSEAIEPIVYYLDPGAPEPIKTALLDGARWWGQAFEAIGYKNAFQVKILPAGADPMDVRYNVIQWVHRATRGWSYGGTVVDPRTGEIIKGHVTLGSLRVKQDYLIALGLTSPFKTENTDTSAMKEMALARIRQLSAHEVGHTLGIAHNFAASANDRASVMDYPHPLITLKNGEIDLSNAYDDKIGQWDKHVVAYGYQDVGTQDESTYLSKVIASTKRAGLQFMSDADGRPRSSAHQTAHLWDNGGNAAVELERVLKVRAKALETFGIHSIPIGTPIAEIESLLAPIYNFHRYQVEAAAKLLAGIQYSYQLREKKNHPPVQVVKGTTQRQALTALMKAISPQTLTLPQRIVSTIPPKAYSYYRDRESFSSKTGLTFDPISAAEANVKHTLSLILNGERLARLAQQSSLDNDIPSIAYVLNVILEESIKQPAGKGHEQLVQQRINQQVVERLLILLSSENTVIEVRSEVHQLLSSLQSWLVASIKEPRYATFNAHFTLLMRQISFGLNENKLYLMPSNVKMPPGSPIGN